MIGPLPKSNGMDAIVIIVDRFTKMVRLKATTINISSEGIAKIYRDKIWKIHGVPETILSDQTERINQEIGTFLRHYVNYKQDDWTEWLAMAEFAYNNKKHVAMGKTPFELNFGRHPWKGDLMVQTEILQVEEFTKNLQESWKHAAQAIEEA